MQQQLEKNDEPEEMQFEEEGEASDELEDKVDMLAMKVDELASKIDMKDGKEKEMEEHMPMEMKHHKKHKPPEPQQPVVVQQGAPEMHGLFG